MEKGQENRLMMSRYINSIAELEVRDCSKLNDE